MAWPSKQKTIKEAKLLKGLKFEGSVEVFAPAFFREGKLEGALLERLGETLIARSTAPDFGARELCNALSYTCKAIRVINKNLDITPKEHRKGHTACASSYNVFDVDAAIQLDRVWKS